MKYSLRTLALAGSLLASSLAYAPVQAAELHVLISGGFSAAYEKLGQQFTAATGNTLVTEHGPSMGKSAESIPNRLARHEPADVVIMVGYALDDLIKQGQVGKSSRVELADSPIGMVVQQGHPKPDISTVEGLRKALLDAKSIAYSDSASGVYIEKEMFKKLGIEEQVKGKATMVPKIPVASQVANGKYEVGFQQVAELLPVPGVTFVGKVPESVQSITRYAGGVPVSSKHSKEAAELLKFLSSAQAQPVVEETGLDPVAKK
ncbi:molybdenum ABC transporter substrate-binding protein [Bordetella sp. H567]|uniref:substrate-binding domain-containing protein n=1 Tax=Bordetella sp. H567 TaxID=1697043 RepID=UPI00081D2FBD|nr:substrate-binding domain-containing protein [Bordetella sp. H567]AOB32633.1 molybdenum ABC transporter substrate-binding protein [Bordetella sp. H567]